MKIGTINKPLVYEIEDKRSGLAKLTLDLDGKGRQRELLLEYPTVYIHNWKMSGNSDKYEVYIGESNDIIRRTREHHKKALHKVGWQVKLKKKSAKMFIIGHEHFNKSLTLDIENRLMSYMLGVQKVYKIYNRRDNPQHKYFTCEERDVIFRQIWVELGNKNPELFPAERLVLESAIFKASPFRDLKKDQKKIKEAIIEQVQAAMFREETGQLIFVSGEAGTGKTVLTSSLFYDLSLLKAIDESRDISCHLVVNHNEQLTVYEQIAKKLNMGNGERIVSKPTSFINSHSPDRPVDVVLIDEAHLLLTRGKQSYRGKNQLDDIRKLAKVVVVMFDKRQILRAEQYWESQIIDQLEEEAKENNNYFKLEQQLRITGSEETVRWINRFTRDQVIEKIPKDDGYEIKIVDTPEELEAMVEAKAAKTTTSLSRLIATFDWEYNIKTPPKTHLGKYWEVMIGNWKKPWNLQIKVTPKEKKENEGLSWAERPQTIGEVGSTFTIQGFDLNYAGVILGPSVKYRDGKIVFDPNCSKNKSATTFRTLSDGTRRKFGEVLICNEVNVLMTRGVQGLYIFACDEELRKALKAAAE